VNDIQIAAGLAGLAALLFVASVIRSANERQYRVLVGVGLALFAATLALVLTDLGRVVDAFGQLGEDLQTQFPTEP
jgi:hypothetical protein